MRFFSDAPDEKTQTNPAPAQRQGSHAVSPDDLPGPDNPTGDDPAATDDRAPATALRDDGTFDDPVVRDADHDSLGRDPNHDPLVHDANHDPLVRDADDPLGPGADEDDPARRAAPDTAAKPFFGTGAEQSLDDPSGGPDAGHRDDEFAFQEPAPQPTAFGAATVGGAVAASAMAGVDRTDAQRTDRDRRADSDADIFPDRSTGNQPASDDQLRDDQPGHDRPGDDQLAGDRPGGDRLADDRGSRDVPGPGDPAEGTGGLQPAAHDTTPGATVGTSGFGSSDGNTTTAGPTGESAGSDDAVVAAPAPTGQLPGTAPVVPFAPLFADDQAHHIRDRWRDVQLRFIDDPRAAAAEARGLIDEAVDTLTAGLRTQRERLGAADTNDTEELRIQIRRYRDFLDHILQL